MIDQNNKGSKKQLNEFAKCISKLEPGEFVGLAKLMNISMVDQNTTEELSKTIKNNDVECGGVTENNDEQKKIEAYKSRNTEEVINDMFAKFITYNRVQRRNLMSILKAASKRK